jgi:tetratricopeptide (TPR) repeat protein
VPIRINIKRKSVLLWLVLSSVALQGQILKDTAALNLLKRGVDDIYGYRFNEARDAGKKLNNIYPGHPVINLYNGMVTYWENYPLIPSSQTSVSYENYLNTCIKQCEDARKPGDYAEYLLANLGARGMLLMYYADNNLNAKLNPLVMSTYRHVRECFDYVSVYPDFYFFTGLYNYYREAYPEAHPIYKMLAFLFPKGDMVKGLIELQNAGANSIMLKAEAYSFLSYIFMSFENNYQESLAYTKGLHEIYPGNLAYLAGYIKNLLLLKKYDEAESIISSSGGETGGSYFKAQTAVFNGILQEKKYRNYNQARKYYNQAINDLSDFGYYGNDYSSYAYFGLSRLSEINNDKQNKRNYRKMALDLTSYKKVNFDE